MTHLHNTDCHLWLPSISTHSVDLILTDPPYGIEYRSNRRTKSPQHEHINGDDNLDWLPAWSDQIYRILRPNRHAYIFSRADVSPVFIHQLERAGFTFKQKLVWKKENHGSGDLTGAYAPQHEEILFFSKGRRELNGKRISDVLENFPLDDGTADLHPTPKPVALLRLLIEKSTSPIALAGGQGGVPETVLDPFAGIGSTGVACIQACHDNQSAPRNFIGCEINHKYWLAAQQRIQAAQAQTNLL